MSEDECYLHLYRIAIGYCALSVTITKFFWMFPGFELENKEVERAQVLDGMADWSHSQVLKGTIFITHFCNLYESLHLTFSGCAFLGIVISGQNIRG